MTFTQRLPPYPSPSARKALTPSQLSQLIQTVSQALDRLLTTESPKDAATASRAFISSYAKHGALQTMQSLVWDAHTIPSEIEDAIRPQVLLLAEKIAPIGRGIDHQTLLDLSIVYAPTHPTRVRAVFLAALDSTGTTFASEIVPAFTKLLATARSAGLYGLRKIAHCITCVIHVSPPPVIRHFLSSRDFIAALAVAYDEILTSMARTYGGLHVDSARRRGLDEWERIWLETKVALMDAFHVLIDQAVDDIGKGFKTGNDSSVNIDQILDILFPILGTSLRPKGDNDATAIPFLNRPLLADYEHAYHLSGRLSSLSSSSTPATDRDQRLDRLIAGMSSFSSDILPSVTSRNLNPGALSLLLLQGPGLRQPDDVPPASHADTRTPSRNDKGKGKDTEPPSETVDLKVAQVREILPDYPQEYIRALLTHQAYQFHGNPEQVVQALLEGTAPTITEVEQEMSRKPEVVGSGAAPDEFIYTAERRNIFDGEDMDLSLVRVGKKRQDENAILRDRRLIEEMKADILRRVEEFSDDEEEEDVGLSNTENPDKGKGIQVVPPTPDEDDEAESGVVSRLKVFGDGEDDSEDGESDEERDATPQPETILELAYIRDPKLFDRDAQTRRSKARTDLKAQTGWTDEQIEGWRIMLERNPKKDRILQKHEFTGNTPLPLSQGDEARASNQHAGVGRGRGRGRGGSRGGRGGASTSGDGGNANDRASKDRNKASRGNHNRKRGHDKKMARAGGPS